MNFLFPFSLFIIVLTYLILVSHYGIYMIFSSLGNHVKWNKNLEKQRIVIYVFLSLIIFIIHFITTLKPIANIYFDEFTKWCSFSFLLISCVMVLNHWRKGANYYTLLRKRTSFVKTNVLQKRSRLINQEPQNALKKQHEEIVDELINIQCLHLQSSELTHKSITTQFEVVVNELNNIQYFQLQTSELLNEVVVNTTPKVHHRKVDLLEDNDIIKDFNILNGNCFNGSFEVFNKWIKGENLSESDKKMEWIYINPENKKNTVTQVSLVAFYDLYFNNIEIYHSDLKNNSEDNKSDFIEKLGKSLNKYFNLMDKPIKLTDNIFTNNTKSLKNHLEKYNNLLNS